MNKMRALLNSLSAKALTETETKTESKSVARAFASWGRLDESQGSATFTVGTMVSRRLRHVLQSHSEFTFTEDKSGHNVKFTVQGPSNFIDAIKRVVEKLTDSKSAWAEHDVMTPDTHASREPTEEESTEARNQISDLIKQGYTSGNSSLSTGARFSWVMKGDGIIEDDEFAQEYVSGLIADGYTSGRNPNWTLEVTIWGDRLEPSLEEGHEEFTYPDGEVYHTEYEAPEIGSRIRDKNGRLGTVLNHSPSRHGPEYSPEVEVEWDDEPGLTNRRSADGLTVDLGEEQIGSDIPHTLMAHPEQSRPGDWHFVGTFSSYKDAEARKNHLMTMGGKSQYNIRRATRDEIDEFLHSGAHGLEEEFFDIASDDGIADPEVLGMDFEGTDVGADFCFGTANGEHHFVDGECSACGQVEEFSVDENDVEQDLEGSFDFDIAPRIPR